MSKVISLLLWFCINTLCDWLTKLVPLSQPMGIQAKTNRVLAAHVFPHLEVTCTAVTNQLHVFASYSDLLIVLFTSVVIGQ